MSFIKCLQKMSFFEGLEEERSLFFSKAIRHELKKGSSLFSRNEQVTNCYYLEKGLVKIYDVTESGKEPIFFLRRTGEMFGLAEIFSGDKRMINAQVLVPSVVYSMDKENFKEFIQQNFSIAERVINVLGNRLRFLGEHISGLTTMTVRERLLRLLLYLLYDNFPRNEEEWDTQLSIHLPVSQEQMAAMIGSTQPTVSSTLQQIQIEGIFTIVRGNIEFSSLKDFVDKVENSNIS